MTIRANYTFTVKEYADGTPWIMLELLKGPDLSQLNGGFLGFDLAPGTTYEQAKVLVDAMRETITTTSYTSLA